MARGPGLPKTGAKAPFGLKGNKNTSFVILGTSWGHGIIQKHIKKMTLGV